MHMADALLSPAVGTAFWAATIGAIGYVCRRLKERLEERLIPLMGAMGAFVFAGQMINFTIPGTGSSGHLGGGMLLAAVLGPQAAFLVMASVLTVQALFFADGGLLALGCNIWNLGVYPCFIAYPLIYRPLAGNSPAKRKILFASVLGAVAALQLGSISVVMQTILSGRSELPFGAFALLMLPIHLAIGIVEGAITAGVISYVRLSRPEVLGSAAAARPLGPPSIRSLVLAFVFLALIAGGVLSWFASAHPDGLEWSIKKVYGRPGLPEQGGVAPALRGVQEKTSFFPDYGFTAPAEEPSQKTQHAWPHMDAGASASGIIGSAIVLGLILLIGVGIRALKAKRVFSNKSSGGTG